MPSFEHSSAQAAPTIPAPTITTSYVAALMCSYSDAVAEGIAWIKHDLALGIHMRRARNTRINFPFSHLDPAFKNAAYYAFLSPHIAFTELSIRIKACQFCAGSSATR